MSINYIIATYNDKSKRKHAHPTPNNILKVHLEKIQSLQHSLTQITIMKATSTNYYKNYYNIKETISKFNIPIKEIECENYGYSCGQWMLAYEMFKNDFDYFIFIEDDYCPNINNFDNLLIDIYKQKFTNNIGLLCSLVQGQSNYKTSNNIFPIHFEGVIMINNKTMEQLYSFPTWGGNPRKWLDLIDASIDNDYNWKKLRTGYLGGYYQVAFSHLFTLSGIEHKDYLNIVNNDNLLCFPYWDDNQSNKTGGTIWFYKSGNIIQKKYNLNNINNSPIIPIQLHNKEAIKHNTIL
jgi:hypothetical protein